MNWLGLDIGGTRLKGGAIDQAGRVIARAAEPTRPDQSLRGFERQLDALVDRIRKEVGVFRGIGAAITGPVNPDVGCIYLPGKIRGLDQHRTVPYLRRRWKTPVLADNDGRLACYAEWKAGAGRGVDNLVVITLGTGIGSGVVLDGSLLTDRHFLRGTQCGHFVIQQNGPRCLTGVHGTGESLASVTALVQSVRDHLARGLPSAISSKSLHDITFPDVIAAAKKRDPLVLELFDLWIGNFSSVLLNAFYAYTPDLILLAGGPTEAAPFFLKTLEARLNATAFRVPPDYPIPVRKAKFGGDAGWIGAALRAREKLETTVPTT